MYSPDLALANGGRRRLAERRLGRRLRESQAITGAPLPLPGTPWPARGRLVCFTSAALCCLEPPTGLPNVMAQRPGCPTPPSPQTHGQGWADLLQVTGVTSGKFQTSVRWRPSLLGPRWSTQSPMGSHRALVWAARSPSSGPAPWASCSQARGLPLFTHTGLRFPAEAHSTNREPCDGRQWD